MTGVVLLHPFPSSVDDSNLLLKPGPLRVPIQTRTPRDLVKVPAGGLLVWC